MKLLWQRKVNLIKIDTQLVETCNTNKLIHETLHRIRYINTKAIIIIDYIPGDATRVY